MGQSGYDYSIEQELDSPNSFFEAERMLEEDDYDFSLVGNGKREIEDGETEVFIYELSGSRREGFYLYKEDDGGIGAEVIESDQSEPVI
ncbi:MAG: hypothetical protein ABEK16_04505 [Candidatus Nanohalobium sp.]